MTTNAASRSSKLLARGAAVVGFASLMALAPGSAQAGFFEQLFGMQPAPEAAPQIAPSYARPDADYAPRPVRPARKRVYVEVIGSGKQTPTDLMHDKTLRQGDAVMMKDGLHIYAGGSRTTHAANDFVALDRSGLPSKERVALAAVDTSRASVAEKDAGSAGTLASGRSAAVSAPIVEGTMVTDARGNKVRYIGP